MGTRGEGMGRTPRVHAGLAHISPIVRRSSRADPRCACRVSGGSLRGLKTLLRGARALDREASGRGLARRVTCGSGVYPAGDARIRVGASGRDAR